MVEYAVSDLVKEVKVLLDRNQESAGLLTPDDTDTLSQAELIESKIVDSARIIEEEAPYYLVAGKNILNLVAPTFTKIGDTYIGRIALPTDFMRLLTIQMDDWDRPAKIISSEDEEYHLQFCKYSGVRGNPHKPVAALVQSSSGDLELELFASKSLKAKLKYGTYIPIPSISNGSIMICEKLKDAIVYMAGYLTCISLGDTDTASGFLGVARKLAHIVEPTETS